MSKQEERELTQFSFIALFAITGFCCFVFSGFIKLIDGRYPWPFIIAGFASMALAVVCWIDKKNTSRNISRNVSRGDAA